MSSITAVQLYERLSPVSYARVCRDAGWCGPADMGFMLSALDLDGKTVADIAIGNGPLSDIFRQWSVGKIIGIDASEDNLNYCLRHRRADEVAYSDVSEYGLPLEDASVDLLTCSGLFSYLSDPATTVDEFARVLKTDGHAVVNFHPSRYKKPETEILPAGRSSVDMIHHPVRQIANMFVDAGMACQDILLNRQGITRLHSRRTLPLVTMRFQKS